MTGMTPSSPRPSRADGPPSDPELARFLRDDLGVADTSVNADKPAWTATGTVWVWRGGGAAGSNDPPPKAVWYFLTIDRDVAISIRAATQATRRGFGSVRVTATIGATSWQTSLFPSKDHGGYLLPLKASVRKAEGLEENGEAHVSIICA